MVAQQRFDAVHADQLSTAHHALRVPNAQRVLDQHNAVWTIVERLGSNETLPPKRLVLERETRLLKKHEAAMGSAFDRVITVTEQDRRAGTVSTLARAIVHAANAGARVINLSVVACIPTLKPVDQTTLGAAVRYAAVDKDAVLVTAAGNTANPGCAQNPDIDATNAADPRNWGQVVTISTPAWFSDYVLAVSATDAVGQPAVDDSGREISLAGPWISVGAPGLFVEGVTAPGGIINATFDSQKNMLRPMSGTSFAAAYVSGLAALIRGKYPQLPAAQVINRITATAHSPAAVVDNRIGHGVIDPLAALNADVPEVPAPRESVSGPLAPPPPPPPVDGRPQTIALVGVGVLAVVLAAVLGIGAMANTKGGPR